MEASSRKKAEKKLKLIRKSIDFFGLIRKCSADLLTVVLYNP